MNNQLTKDLNIDFPIIMAPMFLVSNVEMIQEAIKEGIMGCFPSLNFRNEGELEQKLDILNETKANNSNGNYGVNLIVQRSNPFYEKHLGICVKKRVPFYITSLGNPEKVIEAAHSYGAKVYCDVTNIEHAQKCYDLGCDGFIAVGQGAGGHAGPHPLQILVPALCKKFPDKPVVAAGGIASGQSLLSVMVLGAVGASIGTIFIATKEGGVSNDYKNAIVDSKMDDIVMTERLSGTPCTVINTPYAKKIGYKQNWFEKLIQKNKRLKKYFKMLVQYKGMKKLENAIKPGTYKSLWCAGKSAELVNEIDSVGNIVGRLKKEYEESIQKINTNNL